VTSFIIIIIFIRHMTGQQGMTCTNSSPTKYHLAKTYKTIRHNTHETLKIHTYIHTKIVYVNNRINQLKSTSAILAAAMFVGGSYDGFNFAGLRGHCAFAGLLFRLKLHILVVVIRRTTCRIQLSSRDLAKTIEPCASLKAGGDGDGGGGAT